MIIDARSIPDGEVIGADVCVVGSGAAGIAAARRLVLRGLDVVLLEAGGRRYSRDSQKCYRGEVADPERQPRLDLYRRRQLGGTSTVWGGRCAPLDGIDHEDRPYVPFSGWPISALDLADYYAAAHDVLDLGGVHYQSADCLAGPDAAFLPGTCWNNLDDTKLWRYSLPTNLARKYRSLLGKAGNLRVLLNAPCVELLSQADGTRIASAVAAPERDRKFHVKARAYILAVGGLETARLLLASCRVHARGLGNTFDNVGRYYMTHLYGSPATVRYRGNPKAIRAAYLRDKDRIYVRHMLTVRPQIQRERRLMNFCAVLSEPDFRDPAHRCGVLSAVFLVKGLLGDRLPVELTGVRNKHLGLPLVLRHARNVMVDSPTLMGFSVDWLRRRILARRKLPSASLQSPTGHYHLLFSAEQEPNPDSRVLLSQERDRYGYPQLRAQWRFTENDIASIVGNHRVIAEDMEQNPDRIALDLDFDLLTDELRRSASVGSHHIGTARMSHDPRRGVVDKDCRVHGVANLYVASSAVFPTSSCMSPTLAIVAIALRTADKVAEARAA